MANINDIFIEEIIHKEKLSVEEEKKIFLKLETISKKIYNISRKFFINFFKKTESDPDDSFLNKEDKIKIKRLLKARKKLIEIVIESNIKLIIKLTFNYFSVNYHILQFKKIEFIDMLQNCFLIILTRAIRKFDINNSYRFMTYARNWILCSCRMEKKVVPHVTNLPRLFWNKWKEIKELKDENPSATDKEIIKKLKIYSKTLKLYNNIPLVGQIDEKFNNVCDEENFSLKNIDQEVEEQMISIFKKKLNPKQIYVITKRFGLFGNKRETLDEIGAEMKLTRERIRQI